jgi:hypothetical protein
MSKNRRLPDYGDRESRLRKAYERLGTNTPRCLICGQTNPLRLELHHPAQQEYDDETIILCSSEHDDASDWQKDHPRKIEDPPSVLEIVAHWLFGLGDLLNIAASEPQGAELKELLSYIAAKLHALGHILIDLAKAAASAKLEGEA